MKKNAFTIIEMLAVVLIIGVLGLIIVPKVASLFTKGKTIYYRTVESEISLLAKDYFITNNKDLPTNVSETSVVTLGTLVRDGYIKEMIKDTDDNPCNNSFIVVTNKGNKSYDYTSCLVCANYYSNNLVCSNNMNGIYTSEMPTYKHQVKNNLNIEAIKNTISFKLGDDVLNIDKNDIILETDEVNVNLIGEYYASYSVNSKPIYDHQGKINVVDEVAPEILVDTISTTVNNSINIANAIEVKDNYYAASQISINYQEIDTINFANIGSYNILVSATDPSGNASSKTVTVEVSNELVSYTPNDGTWTNQNTNIGLALKSVEGLDVSSWKYRIGQIQDGRTTWGSYINGAGSTASVTLTNQGIYALQTTVTYTNGQTMSQRSGYYRIDKTAPICGNVVGESTIWQKDSRLIQSGCSDNDSGCTAASYSKTFSTTTQEGNITIIDNAGNSAICPVNAYVDITSPVCGAITGGGSISNWTNEKRNLSIACSDLNSGCVANSYNGEFPAIGSNTNLITTDSISIKDIANNITACPVGVYYDKVLPTKGPSIAIHNNNSSGTLNTNVIGNTSNVITNVYTNTLQNYLTFSAGEDQESGIGGYMYTTGTSPVKTNGSGTNATSSNDGIIYSAYSKDKAGNVSKISTSIKLIFDDVKPTTPVVTAEADTNNVTVSATSSDAKSGIKNYNFAYTTESCNYGLTYYTQPTNSKIFEGIIPDGIYNFCVYSTDKANNKSEIGFATVEVINSILYENLDSYISYTGTYEKVDDGNGNWRIKFLTSGTLRTTTNMIVDAFVVGGGGAGVGAGVGAGGGYTNTYKSIEINKNIDYNVVVGAGGVYNSTTNGEQSYFINQSYSANGGNADGSGGSGGGGNGNPAGSGGCNAGSGGFDGGNGGSGCRSAGGSGQGTTTREFGLESADLYAGGGGGYGNSMGSGGSGGGGNGGKLKDGTANTGGGGGAGNGNGGSGIVIIRNAKWSGNSIVYNGIEMGKYTGTFEVSNDIPRCMNCWKIKFLTSGVFTPSKNMIVDAFVVGGGGAGVGAGGGAGGGYTNTYTSINLTKGNKYDVVVGYGGKYYRESKGETSYFIDNVYNSLGGNEGTSSAGGIGGSGGGGGGNPAGSGGCSAGKGGSDGSVGNNGCRSSGGAGQGATTREFGESTGDLYAGGGGGYGNSMGSGGAGGGGNGSSNVTLNMGTANTGGGGGSGNGNGGSGIIIIRDHNYLGSPIVINDTIVGYTTTTYEVEAEDSANWNIKILSNGTFAPAANLNADIFLVGGGGGGGNGTGSSGGGGGGGGLIQNNTNVSLIARTMYDVTIGDGGASSSNGGSTIFTDEDAINFSAGGGSGGSGGTGGAGGSGGGAGGPRSNGGSTAGGLGGTNGSNGLPGANNGNNYGLGIGTTTGEFANSGATLYSSGGNGEAGRFCRDNNGDGSYNTCFCGTGAGTDGLANTGNGGGGGQCSGTGGTGGTGIIVIRNSR